MYRRPLYSEGIVRNCFPAAHRQRNFPVLESLQPWRTRAAGIAGRVRLGRRCGGWGGVVWRLIEHNRRWCGDGRGGQDGVAWRRQTDLQVFDVVQNRAFLLMAFLLMAFLRSAGLLVDGFLAICGSCVQNRDLQAFLLMAFFPTLVFSSFRTAPFGSARLSFGFALPFFLLLLRVR